MAPQRQSPYGASPQRPAGTADYHASPEPVRHPTRIAPGGAPRLLSPPHPSALPITLGGKGGCLFSERKRDQRTASVQPACSSPAHSSGFQPAFIRHSTRSAAPPAPPRAGRIRPTPGGCSTQQLEPASSDAATRSTAAKGHSTRSRLCGWGRVCSGRGVAPVFGAAFLPLWWRLKGGRAVWGRMPQYLPQSHGPNAITTALARVYAPQRVSLSR